SFSGSAGSCGTTGNAGSNGSSAAAGVSLGGTGSLISAARSISRKNDCDVFCTSRITRPAWRMTPGSFFSPKTRSARTPRIAISGIESTPALLRGLPRGPVQGCASREDHLYAGQPDGDSRLPFDVAQDSQSVCRAPGLLRSLQPQQARA